MKKKYNWERFLTARADMIHEFHSDGKSDEEIRHLLSMDIVQTRLIREGTKPSEEYRALS